MSDQPLTVLILGHSFVRRATDYIQLNPTLSNLGLSKDTHDIHFISRPGCHARNLRNSFSQILEIQPDLILLDIGTNDLTVMSPQQLFSQVYAVAQDIIDMCQVKRVVLLQVLPRTVEGRWGQPPPFQEKVESYNSLLKSQVYQDKMSSVSPQPTIGFWFHKGFRTDISSLISDGVHLNDAGLPLYIRSLRRAVLKASPEVRRALLN